MHHIYKTKGIVLSSKPLGEAGKIITVLTNDFGLIKIRAEAVRKLESKLRQSIQDFSVLEVAFVRGKIGNKLTGATTEYNLYEIFWKEKNAHDVFLMFFRVFGLIERLQIDEEIESFSFEIIKSAIDLLKEKQDFDANFLKKIEIILVMKVLNNLGYLENLQEFQKITSEKLSQELIYNLKESQIKNAIRIINQSIKASQL